VQLGLLLVHPHEDVAQLALDAQAAGLVQAGLRPVGGAEPALGPGQRQQVLGERVGVVVPAVAVPVDALQQRALGLRVPAVLDRDRADRVQHRRVQVVAVLGGHVLQPPGDLLGTLVVTDLELGVRIIVEHSHQQPRSVEPAAQVLGLRVPQAGGLHRPGQAERVGQLGAVPDLHVHGGVLVEQLDREHRVLQALGRVAEQPVNVGPDQVDARLQLRRLLLDGPLVDLPDLPGGGGEVAVAHEHVRAAEPGPVQEHLIAQLGGPLLQLGRGGQRGGGVPEVVVLDRQQRGRQLRRVVHALRHLPPLSLTAPDRLHTRGGEDFNALCFRRLALSEIGTHVMIVAL
jgi:hypothetical protein